jgi:FMN phosphatase YigB (HAD superfamily)
MLKGIIFDFSHTICDTTSLMEYYQKNNSWKGITHKSRELELFKEIPPIIKFLDKNNIPWGILTTLPNTVVQYYFEKYDYIFGNCKGIIAYHDVNNHKPYPEGVHKLLQLMELQPSLEIFGVGDKEDDIEAYNSAGITSIKCSWLKDDRKATKADFSISEGYEIQNIRVHANYQYNEVPSLTWAQREKYFLLKYQFENQQIDLASMCYCMLKQNKIFSSINPISQLVDSNNKEVQLIGYFLQLVSDVKSINNNEYLSSILPTFLLTGKVSQQVRKVVLDYDEILTGKIADIITIPIPIELRTFINQIKLDVYCINNMNIGNEEYVIISLYPYINTSNQMLYQKYPIKYSSYPNDNMRNIYDFKNGENNQNEIKELVSILSKIPEIDNKNWILVELPASSKTKNEKRYKDFFQELSYLSGLDNGFSQLIKINNDRKELKGDALRSDKTLNLLYDKSMISGRNIILIDDVTTSGISIKQNLEKLYQCGASKIIVITLVKTVR